MYSREARYPSEIPDNNKLQANIAKTQEKGDDDRFVVGDKVLQK